MLPLAEKNEELCGPFLYIISRIGSDIKQSRDTAWPSAEIHHRLLFASAKPRNPGYARPHKGRLHDLIVLQPRKTSRVSLSLPLSSPACSTRLINLFRQSFATGTTRSTWVSAISGLRLHSDVRFVGYTGGCFRFRDVQYYALLAHYQNKALAKRRGDGTMPPTGY